MIANLYDKLEDTQQAAKWFKILHGSVPSDPKVLPMLHARPIDASRASFSVPRMLY
jgi:hypothetical protein